MNIGLKRNRGDCFDLLYPFAAEYFEVFAVKTTAEDANIFKNIIDRFAELPHSKAWFRGEEITISITDGETVFRSKVERLIAQSMAK